MRLLAAVPSVIYGLIGILVLVPFVGNHLISRGAQGVGGVRGPARRARACSSPSLILTVMITPIMIAIIVDALRAVPRGWTEGAAALGVNRWRAMWTIAVRAARPAIVAAAVLATARALGEAIMLSMVSGSVGLRAQPARRPHLLLRAGAAARGDDRRQRRGPLGRAVRPDDLRVRGGAARLERRSSRSAAGRPSSRCKRYGVAAVMAGAPHAPGARRRRAARVEPRAWRLARPHRRSACCWAAGHLAVR